ncbi:NAD(P)/FAD-dependent oxidoreductase [Ramlibacter sp. WS9]|uniref:NAD(P)/FAD-dependent oxidoreductase n=1 Tax=Ramlibacter sp. WS9 TaxID=1882741 RepID=UPI0011411EF4|nr:FAD-dependent oxidoreductase [Ramlibacter sp. WS9]ROZ66092.1 pyridine nucleotide-disulfide oxidoreductase [Ramlibacter sp. WS9]
MIESDEVLTVIGAGQAGAELAVQAREGGWPGRILLAGDEPDLPYHRPPLSKAYLAGTATTETLALKARATYEHAGIELVLGRRVVAVDRKARRVEFDGGPSIDYSRLAFATGGRPRRLPTAASGADRAANFHYLRTLADVDRIRARFIDGARLVIIGGGYVGLEVAAVAVKQGLQVVVLEAAERILSRVTAPAVSAFYETVHRAAGVDVRTGMQVETFELNRDRSRVSAVVCRDGERLACDLVVAGIGLVPNTELAADCGLAVDDGILVDAAARTSDPHIVAAGDCTRYHSALYDRSIRLESVPNALEQARCAAATLTGQERRFDGVPWFWSDQYDLKLKMVGLSQGYDQLVLRGSPDAGAFCAFYLKGRRVLAVDTVNRVPDFMVAKRLVGERIEVDPDRLADEAVPLKSLLPA